MIQIREMQESQYVNLLKVMLNFVFPSGSFCSEGHNLYIHEDQLPTIVDEGILRNKYIEVTKLHSALLDVKER